MKKAPAELRGAFSLFFVILSEAKNLIHVIAEADASLRSA